MPLHANTFMNSRFFRDICVDTYHYMLILHWPVLAHVSTYIPPKNLEFMNVLACNGMYKYIYQYMSIHQLVPLGC